jgi:NDP-4-keto-2,6-dideoxyhexose 3-C-methyltransferase
MFHKIKKCRICGNTNLISVLDLEEQYLSGIFPKTIDTEMYRGPLELVKCDESSTGCGHVQLHHTFDLPTMYGDEYGYRSGLNQSMITHLQNKYEKISKDIKLNPNDIIVDIAGNDGTFLGFFPEYTRRLSIDPTAKKFAKYYNKDVDKVAEFFSKEVYETKFGEEKAKVITSFSMFYDLEDPCEFARQVNDVLDPNEGIWVTEQSYMPEMLHMNSFDTVCHEHLSYYGMRQLKYIMDQSNFKIIDFEFNDINGGSISVISANKNSKYEECSEKLAKIVQAELDEDLNTIKPWEDLKIRINECKNKFYDLINECKSNNLKIAALGASTKGNVTLQTWGIDDTIVEVVGDVNPDKNGSYTPGTWIPIRSEDEVMENYDVFVILPWHFRKFFVNNPKFKGKKLLFPLPTPEIVQL